MSNKKAMLKFRSELSSILGLKGILGEEIAPTEYILAEIQRIKQSLTELQKQLTKTTS